MDERELRKKSLRSRMIETAAMEPAEDETDIEEVLDKRRRNRRLVVFGILAALIVAAAIILIYRSNYKYTGSTTVWTKDLPGGALSEYVTFGENLVKYNRDGISCINVTGETVWTHAYEMKSPTVSESGDFLVVADRQGYAMHICDRSGNVKTIKTNEPISRVSISSQGIVTAILEGKNSNKTALYDKNGSLLAEIATVLSKSGYPLDVSISPNGAQVMTSYVYLNQGLVLNQVIFRNFSKVGGNLTDKLVGGFKEYKENIVADVEFLTDTYACAIADNQLGFYSLKNEVQPALVSNPVFEGEILSVFYDSQGVGVITKNSTDENPYMLHVFGPDGSEQWKKTLNFAYKYAEFGNERVLLYNDSECVIYSDKGEEKYRGTLDGSINKVLDVSRDKLIQVSGDTIKEIKLN